MRKTGFWFRKDYEMRWYQEVLRSMHPLRQIILLSSAALVAAPLAAQQQNAVYFRPVPGAAQATVDASSVQLANSVIRAIWQVKENHLVGASVQDRLGTKK